MHKLARRSTTEMNDEEQNFKVIDRRPFNPDGTPRDVPRDEQPAEGAPSSASPQTKTPAAEKAAEAAFPSASQAGQRTGEMSTGTGPESVPTGQASARAGDATFRRAARPAPSEVQDERELPGADDPASFLNLIMSIASNAAAAMGMMPHPATGETGIDLKSAKYWIDVLGMLEQKTLGNLQAQEQKVFESLLADLRMQYVSLSGAPSPPEKFTGRDITGGR